MMSLPTRDVTVRRLLILLDATTPRPSVYAIQERSTNSSLLNQSSMLENLKQPLKSLAQDKTSFDDQNTKSDLMQALRATNSRIPPKKPSSPRQLPRHTLQPGWTVQSISNLVCLESMSSIFYESWIIKQAIPLALELKTRWIHLSATMKSEVTSSFARASVSHMIDRVLVRKHDTLPGSP